MIKLAKGVANAGYIERSKENTAGDPCGKHCKPKASKSVKSECISQLKRMVFKREANVNS